MTVPIGVNPAPLGLSAGIETAGAGTLAGATGAAAPAITAVLPPGGDAASAAASAGLNARGAETVAMTTELTTMGSLFADTVGVNGIGYAEVDGINEAALAI